MTDDTAAQPRPASRFSAALRAQSSARFGLGAETPFARHRAPVALLCLLCLLRWAGVLFTGRVLLPGDMLRGFAPFGSDPRALWDILRWDSLGQYYPWRVFAARELHNGTIPLWNPHQFAGAPFLANAQSAVFYPLNIVFWAFDPARAFALSALLHSLLACLGTYALLQRWQLSRASSLVGAVAFGFCGYLTAWTALPTLANTAAWLPLLLVLLERASENLTVPRLVALSAALCSTMLAGHAQIFLYGLIALALRAGFLHRRAFGALLLSGLLALPLGAAQLLPTLELARLGHRATSPPTLDAWQKFLQPRALQPSELPSLFVPDWPMVWGSFSENFGYVGVGAVLLALGGAVALLAGWREFKARKPFWFALVLTASGLLYGLGTWLAEAFYFGVPGIAQMGGVGRALVLWSLGAALLGAYGVEALRQRMKSPVVPVVALLVVGAELLSYGWGNTLSAPREAVYPATELTTWLQARRGIPSRPNRVLFVTRQGSWQRSEDLLQLSGGQRSHPVGALPPNGAILYGLYDVNGYDSLAPRDYRAFLTPSDGRLLVPQTNANMILLQNDEPQLDALNVRYIVTSQEDGSCPTTYGSATLGPQLSGSCVYQRAPRSASTPVKNGHDFYPGSRDGAYQPTTFRLGGFLMLCACAVGALLLAAARRDKLPDEPI